MAYLYFPYSGLINAVTSCILGVFVLSKNYKSATNRRFAYFAFSVTFWAFNYFLWLMSKNYDSALFFIRSAMVGAILIPATYGYFTSRLLEIDRTFRDSANFIIAFILICFSFSPLFIERVEPRMFFSFWPVPGYLFHVMLLYFVIHVVQAIWDVWDGLQNALGVKREQIRFVFIGTVIGYVGGCTNYFLWYDLPIPPYLNVLVSVYIFCVSYAIVRHQLMDIKFIIKKTIVFAGLFIAAYATFAFFAYLGTNFFESFTESRWIAMVPSVLVIVLILRPLEILLRNITDKYLFQKKYDYKELLKTFTNEVLTVLDLGELVDITVRKLSDIVKLENTSILLRDEESEEFKLVSTTGSLDSEYKLSNGDILVDYLASKNLLLINSYSEKAYSEGVTSRMKDFQGELVMPLVHHNKMIGILSFGKKKSDEEFTQDDIDILTALSRTLSIAIANALLFDKLSQAQAQAAQREKMAVIGTLSAGINHEICNPLGIARGQCEMFLLNMEEGMYKEKTSEELLDKARLIMKKVIHETDRATNITRKLSSFAKPPKGTFEDDVNVEKELDEVVTLVEHDLKLDNILIIKEIERNLPFILVDKKQVQEIFFNIIRNAVQAIGDSGTITIRAKKINDRVFIDIEDSGKGMDKKELGQIFNPFYTTKEPGRGTGLGLFIVRQIVNKNKGKVEVKSQPGKGTTVTLTFKAVTPKSRDAKKEAQAIEERNI